MLALGGLEALEAGGNAVQTACEGVQFGGVGQLTRGLLAGAADAIHGIVEAVGHLLRVDVVQEASAARVETVDNSARELIEWLGEVGQMRADERVGEGGVVAMQRGGGEGAGGGGDARRRRVALGGRLGRRGGCGRGVAAGGGGGGER